MKKYLFIILLFAGSLASAQEKPALKHLKTLSSDEMQGRGFGTDGGTMAQEYIRTQFKQLDLKPAFGTSYMQSFKYKGKTGNNVVAVIPGSTDDVIVVTAHFDHLGEKDGKIFNGADDNASGTAALFSIGEYFKSNKPKHTLILAAVDAEEVGSGGAEYLLKNFPSPKENIVLNVNMDMIAHNDKNELYAVGTYHYPQLKEPLSNIESEINILFGHDSPKDNDDWTYASDHRVFHRKKIPFIYFGVEDHEDYHQPSDTFENINQEFYLNAIDLIIQAIKAYDSSDALR